METTQGRSAPTSGYVTFVDPTPENGVYAFARIAEELGRRRPEIPLLVVEGRGTERTLADCGLDLRGNVHLMSGPGTSDGFWGVTRVLVIPTASWEAPPTLAEEAAARGVPVVGSDRGGIPAALGNAGVVLPLPARLMPDRGELPTAAEVVHWVEAILRLWDDPGAGAGPGAAVADPGRCVILVPVGHHIEPACDDALRGLERRGYPVRRVRGFSAIDQGRNQIATDALRDGFEELMWIDSDVAFEPEAVDRLRSHGLPITCGVYPKKGQRSFASNFSEGVAAVVFGNGGGLVEIPYAGAGFLHTRREVYDVLKERLGLPECNGRWGPTMVPFFQPIVIPLGAGHWYLAEDYSFCHRARECGFRILADTTFRLQHIGSYPYSWEDAGGERTRYGRYTFYIND